MKPSAAFPGFWGKLRIFLCGFCMGTADLVPGVSGGTMAWITGIYESFIQSIESFSPSNLRLLLSRRWREALSQIQWRFLAALGLGMLTAVAILAPFVNQALHDVDSRPLLYASFFGLITASIFFCARLIRTWSLGRIAAIGLGILGGFCFTQMKPMQSSELYTVQLPAELELPEQSVANYDPDKRELRDVSPEILGVLLRKGRIAANTPVKAPDGPWRPAGELFDASPGLGVDWRLFGGGAIAVCAMLLPGVSGAYLLNIMGLYTIVIGALADLSRGFELYALIQVLSFGVGVVTGAALFSRVIDWLFKHYHCATIALLTGFMIGALPIVWPFWELSPELNPLKFRVELAALRMQGPDWTAASTAYAALAALCGFFLVFALEALAIRFGVAEQPDPV